MGIDMRDAPIPKTGIDHGKHPERLTPAQFRAAVWIRDRGRDRATGQILYPDHPDPHFRGQVCHLRGRRVMPEWMTDPQRAILLSDANHILTDARGNRLLRLTDPITGEPATDGSKPIRFTLRTFRGDQVWTRVR